MVESEKHLRRSVRIHASSARGVLVYSLRYIALRFSAGQCVSSESLTEKKVASASVQSQSKTWVLAYGSDNS